MEQQQIIRTLQARISNIGIGTENNIVFFIPDYQALQLATKIAEEFNLTKKEEDK